MKYLSFKPTHQPQPLLQNQTPTAHPYAAQSSFHAIADAHDGFADS